MLEKFLLVNENPWKSKSMFGWLSSTGLEAAVCLRGSDPGLDMYLASLSIHLRDGLWDSLYVSDCCSRSGSAAPYFFYSSGSKVVWS